MAEQGADLWMEQNVALAEQQYLAFLFLNDDILTSKINEESFLPSWSFENFYK